MSMVAHVVLGWAIAVVGLVGYTTLLVRRGRSLSERVPPAERRWM